MQLFIVTLYKLYLFVLLSHAIVHYDDNSNIDYKWNPLQFPSTKIYTIISFDDVSWDKIINRTNPRGLNHICDLIKECCYDAFGYTLVTDTTTTSTTDLSAFHIDYDSDSLSSSSSSSRRRLLSNSQSDESSSEEAYDALLNGVISFKNIEKSLLSNKRLNFTFGILFNNMDIYDEFKSLSIDSMDPNYQFLRAVFHQCLYLTLNIKHIEFHIMSISDGIYPEEYKKHKTENNTVADFNLDIEQALNPKTTETETETTTATATEASDNPVQYKVMTTLNAACISSSATEMNIDHIIDTIITFYSDCLDWKDDTDDDDKYTTYKVSDMDLVYFFKIIDNDKRCLIHIDMEYLSTQCVDMIEYEPIYTLDSTQCDALDVSTLNVWNLDFFDGSPGDNIYNILDINKHNDHGVDQYILDTGILSTHQIFNNNDNHNLVYIHHQRVSGNALDGGSASSSPAPFTPSHYHGTFVAGIAGGDIYGTSRNLTIYDYEVCEGSSCSYSKVLAGIEAAKLNMISTGRRGVINLSFGGAIAATNTVAREKWDFIMKGIIDAGGIPVCSAGNTQLDGCNYVPGQSKYCISVGAFDVFGNLYSRTNYGECVNIFAPGVNIKSAGTSSTSQYIVRSGTSAAAPHITGLISNLLWMNPALTFDHIVYIMDENRQYLSSCPNNYTHGTQCPYISLPCSSFQEAINTAILHVPVELLPTKPPTEQSTTSNTIIIRDNGIGGGGGGDEGNVIYDETTTVNPTQHPTKSPTEKPTTRTTPTPTARPVTSTSPTDAPVIEHTVALTLSPSDAPKNEPTDEPTQSYQGLGLGGFNNGFTVDFSKIMIDNNESSLIHADDIHNDTYSALHSQIILRFSFILSVLYLI